MIGVVLAGRRAKGRVEPAAELRPAMIERAELARARLAAKLDRSDIHPHTRRIALHQLRQIDDRLADLRDG